MPTYTLTITRNDGETFTTLTTFGDDRTAIDDVKLVLTDELPTVALARGAGDDIVSLGVWDWCAGEPKFTS